MEGANIITDNSNKEDGTKLETAKEIMLKGLQLHEENHGRDERGGKEAKSFHGVGHPETLMVRSEKIANILGLSPKKVTLLKMVIAYHDIVIEYDKPNKENVVEMVKRHRGAMEGDQPSGALGNEALSAKLLKETMLKTGVFTPEEMDVASKGIYATYPAVDFGEEFQSAEFKKYPYYENAIKQNPELGELLHKLETGSMVRGVLFSQPYLEKDLEEGRRVPEEVLIMGLVDIGGAGCAESQEFFKEGNAEMRELYYNIQQPEVMKRLKDGKEKIDTEDRKKAAEEFLKWLELEVGFTVWQALRFEKIIYLLNKNKVIDQEKEIGLRRFFNHYLENIQAASLRSENLRKEYQGVWKQQGERQAFIWLAEHLGYKI